MYSTAQPSEDDRAYAAAVRRALQSHGHSASEPERAEEYVLGLTAKGLPVIFDQRHLSTITGVRSQTIGRVRSSPDQFYRHFWLPKRSGGSRKVSAPTPALRRLQDFIHSYITSLLTPHAACHGFMKGRSIVTNAAPHCGQPIILKLDIRDFFGSVDRRTVFTVFRRIGYSRAVANMLCDICMLDGSLPQGAPTSPALANLAALELDVRLAAFAERRGFSYTRYADDITVSGPGVDRSRSKRAIEAIMRDSGFAPNEAKLRFLTPAVRQSVTGIVVNEKLNWPRDRRRWLRQQVHYMERFGVESHVSRLGTDRAGYRDFIYGHVYALMSLRPLEAASHLAVLDTLDWDARDL